MIKALSDKERALRVSGLLIGIGLLSEAVSLLFNHPFAFMGFIFLGGGLAGLGMVIYVWSWSRPSSEG